MKIKLNEVLKGFDAFKASLNEDAVVAAPTAPKTASPRDSIVSDVNNIITSLETLATKITEEIEAVAEEGPSVVGDLIRLPKYIGTQKKINKMKLSAEEVNFAAQNEKESEAKAKLKEKYKAIQDQVKKLETDFDKKVEGRASLIKKSVSYLKIKGQMEVLKVIYGVTSDTDKKADLKERMGKLGERMKEEADAVKELRKKAEDKKETQPSEALEVNEFVDSVIELELELFEDEALDEATTDKGANLGDYFIYAPRFVKVQKRINKMKLQSNDLGFAAAGLGRSAENADKKAALVDKKRMLDDQIKQLQIMLDDKITERGPRVKRKVEQTRIEGQIELLNHMIGRETDPNDKRDLKQRMADLKRREQEEADALQKYADQDQADVVDAKGDDEELRLKGELNDLKAAVVAAKEAGNALEVKKAELEAAKKELELRVEQGNVDATQSAKEKVAKVQKAILDLEAKAGEKTTETPAADAPKANEPMDAQEAPAADTKEAKMAKLETRIEELKQLELSTLQEVTKVETALKNAEAEKAKSTNPASMDAKINSLKQQIAGLKEDVKDAVKERTAKIKELQALQAKNEALELNENINKIALLNRAEAVGLTDLAAEIANKQEWQLNKTALYSKYNSAITVAENTAKLETDKYTTASVKDRLSKLI